MKARLLTGLFIVSAALSGCWNAKPEQLAAPQASLFTEETPIADVMKDPAFGDYGRLLFPVDNSYYSGKTLGELRLVYYSHIHRPSDHSGSREQPENACAGGRYGFLRHLHRRGKGGGSGLFFFQGEPGSRFAVCCADGAFAYVGAMHDSFPHALEISRHGHHAFALIYRPGAQNACEDLALAGFIKEIGLPTSLRELGIDESLDLGAVAASCNVSPGSYGKMSHEEIARIFEEAR